MWSICKDWENIWGIVQAFRKFAVKPLANQALKEHIVQRSHIKRIKSLKHTFEESLLKQPQPILNNNKSRGGGGI